MSEVRLLQKYPIDERANLVNQIVKILKGLSINDAKALLKEVKFAIYNQSVR